MDIKTVPGAGEGWGWGWSICGISKIKPVTAQYTKIPCLWLILWHELVCERVEYCIYFHSLNNLCDSAKQALAECKVLLVKTRPAAAIRKMMLLIGISVGASSKIWRKLLRIIWMIFKFTFKSLSCFSISIETLYPDHYSFASHKEKEVIYAL